MKLLVRAFPVLPGREGQVRALAEEILGERRFEADEFYRRMGIVRETWHLQQTDAGPMAIVCTEVRDLEEAARAYAASEHPFDAWLKQQVRRLSGVDRMNSRRARGASRCSSGPRARDPRLGATRLPAEQDQQSGGEREHGEQ
jgi:hypothetical protein